MVDGGLASQGRLPIYTARFRMECAHANPDRAVCVLNASVSLTTVNNPAVFPASRLRPSASTMDPSDPSEGFQTSTDLQRPGLTARLGLRRHCPHFHFNLPSRSLRLQLYPMPLLHLIAQYLIHQAVLLDNW